MTKTSNNGSFSDIEVDALGEILNISMGSAATALSNLLEKRVNITIPEVYASKAGDIQLMELDPAIGVEITYVEGLVGTNIMVLKRKDVKSIVNIMTGGMIDLSEAEELDELSISAICEAMNQMMGASATALSEFLDRTVNISTPRPVEVDADNPFKNENAADDMMVVTFDFEIEDTVQSKFVSVMTEELAKELINTIMGGGEPSAPEVVVAAPQVPPVSAPEQVQPQVIEQPKVVANQNVGISAGHQAQPQMSSSQNIRHEPSEARPVQLPNFDETTVFFGDERAENLDLIRAVPLEVTVEIGRASKKVKEILEFTKGTVVELDKQAGAQVDVMVNGQLIAKGDVVVIGDNFGVRITEILKREGLLNL